MHFSFPSCDPLKRVQVQLHTLNTLHSTMSFIYPSRITPRIYLSDLYTASNEDEVTNLGITHVISVFERQPTLPTSITPEQRLHFPIADRPHVDILRHLETTTNFISSALAQNESNKVLVSANRASCGLWLI